MQLANQKQGRDQTPTNVAERLALPNTRRQSWVAQQVIERQKEEADACTFRPEVTMFAISEEPTSQLKLLSPKTEKRQGTDVFDRLRQKPIGWGDKIINKPS